MLIIIERYAEWLLILVDTHTMQFIWITIQQETLLSIKGIPADAYDSFLTIVDHSAILTLQVNYYLI
jgi:hypothetical protein